MTEHRTPYQAGDGPQEPSDKLPCGHPLACVRVDEVAHWQFETTCTWCESLEVARWQERLRCRDLAMEIAASLRNCDIATEASLAAERVAREIMDEGSQDG